MDCLCSRSKEGRKELRRDWWVYGVSFFSGTAALVYEVWLRRVVDFARLQLLVSVAGVGSLWLIAAPSDVQIWKWEQKDHRLLRYVEGVAASLAVVEDRQGRRRLKVNNSFAMGGEGGPLPNGVRDICPCCCTKRPGVCCSLEWGRATLSQQQPPIQVSK